jgi:hypothetical protein
LIGHYIFGAESLKANQFSFGETTKHKTPKTIQNIKMINPKAPRHPKTMLGGFSVIFPTNGLRTIDLVRCSCPRLARATVRALRWVDPSLEAK